MNKTISREASDKTKGFRLQKLRAASLIIDAIEESKYAHIYSAIEHIEDVYIKDISCSKSKETLEENKNYDIDSSFTLNLSQVLNTLVSFIDCYINKGLSNNVYFGFYSTNDYGKESCTKKIKLLNITLPKKPLFNYLINEELSSEILDIIKKLIINEYTNQYKKRKDGYLEFIKKLDNKDWIIFLNKINWGFGKPNNEDLEKIVLEKIRNSRNFSPSLVGSEGIILAQILELYDKRQNVSDPTERFVHAGEIEVIFLRTSSGAVQTIQKIDPVHDLWNTLDPPTDSRNIKEKIASVCGSFAEDLLKALAREISMSKCEEASFSDKKEYLSLKYRIFHQCDSLMAMMNNDGQMTPEKINKILNDLKEKSKEIIDQLSEDYEYSHNSLPVISGIVLDLFDSCYLAFD